MKARLVGYMRRSKNGGALRLNISKEEFNASDVYVCADGTEYVGLIVNFEKVVRLIEGTQEVTSVCQILPESDDSTD